MLNIRLAFAQTSTYIFVRSVPFPLIIPHYSILHAFAVPFTHFRLRTLPIS